MNSIRWPVALGRMLFVVGLSSLAGCSTVSVQPALPTVASVDLNRYLGTWYEIALLPNRFEIHCTSDTQANYSMDERGIRIVNRCRMADGRVDSAEGRANIVAASGNAKLRVTFFWPFYGDYWILALDDDYSEVLVGTPDRRYGWILARRPDLPEARVQALLERARVLGFDAAAFRRVPQVQPLDGAS